MNDANIRAYIEDTGMHEGKLTSFVFWKLCSALQRRNKRELSNEELSKIDERLTSITRANPSTWHVLYDLALDYTFAEMEEKTGKKVTLSQRIALAYSKARELGYEGQIRSQFMVFPENGNKHYFSRFQDFSRYHILSRMSQKKLEREITEGPKRTINGFKPYTGKLKDQRLIGPIPAALLITNAFLISPFTIYAKIGQLQRKQNLLSEIIDDYESRMDKYAEELRKLNLSDLELIMKIMDDMHTNIIGYDEPKIDIPGFYRLDVGNSRSGGVCRNMADHVSYVLNKVNPKYRARVLSLYTNLAGAETAIETKSNRRYVRQILDEWQFEDSRAPNHDVVTIDMPGQKCRLVIDPTVTALGVLANNKITMFNDSRSGGLAFSPKSEAARLAFGGNVAEGRSIFYGIQNMNGYPHAKVDIRKLKEQWGLRAQKEALERVRGIPGAFEMANTAYTSYLHMGRTTLAEMRRKKEKAARPNTDKEH
jgi:hypothetical protein